MIPIFKSQETSTTRNIEEESVTTLIQESLLKFFPELPDADNSLEFIQLKKKSSQVTRNFQLFIDENSKSIPNLNFYRSLSILKEKFNLENKQIITYRENTESTLQTKNVPVFLSSQSSPSTENRKNISFVPQSQALQVTQERLIELLKEDDEDEYGILKPTPYAFDKAWSLTLNASQFLKNNFRKASVCTDDEGGIRLTWSKVEAEAEVRLICPSGSHKEVYLYHEKGLEYYVVKDVTAFTLASWLDWLNKV